MFDGNKNNTYITSFFLMSYQIMYDLNFLKNIYFSGIYQKLIVEKILFSAYIRIINVFYCSCIIASDKLYFYFLLTMSVIRNNAWLSLIIIFFIRTVTYFIIIIL